jgi:hypothetical protein
MAANPSRSSPSARLASGRSPLVAGADGAPAPVRNRIVALRFVRAAELIPNRKRWRRHSGAQGRSLRAVLEEVGYAGACVARRSPEGLVLLDGHLRADLDPGAVLPVLVLDVTEEEGDTILASYDALASMARPDPAALERLLKEVTIPEETLLEHLRSMLADPVPATPLDRDLIPPRPRRSRVRRGQLWALGAHRLLCGDARSPEDLDRVMAGELARMLWTDPPFGVSYVGKTAEALRIENDEAAGLETLLTEVFEVVDHHLRPGARLYMAHPAGELQATFLWCFLATGWRLHQTIVWVKDAMVLGHADYQFRHEPLLFGYKLGPGRWGRGAKGWYGGNAETSVLEIPRPKASREHPTAKPVELVARCLANSSRRGDVVLDPFAGSGRHLSRRRSSEGGAGPSRSTPGTATSSSPGGRR